MWSPTKAAKKMRRDRSGLRSRGLRGAAASRPSASRGPSPPCAPPRPSALVCGGIVGLRERLDQLVVERGLGPLDHRQAVAALVVLDLIHDVVDEEDSAARGLEEV